jgi:hypothetical protein
MPSYNQPYSQYIGSISNTAPILGGDGLLLARVTHVVQGPFYVGTATRDPNYTDPTTLGNITYNLISSPQDRTLESAGNPVAKPLFFGFKQYPVEGELVYLVAGPSVDMNESRGARSYFYLPPYNLWGAANHNAFPDMGDYQEYVSVVGRTYADSLGTGQAINLSGTASLTFPLGPNFPEKGNIRSLRQFTGDTTIEGRWGNSIRLGSTTFSPDETIRENNWSQDSELGNPITIIRNGQGTPSNNIPWFPTVEDINKDPSSIYLTQGQKIVIDDIQRSFSLASLNISLETTRTVAVPIQQQLTSTDTTSAVEQDKFTQTITNPTPANNSTPPATETVEPTAVTARVVGDYQDLSAIDGSYVISLRVVDSAGNILNSVSTTSNTAQAAYQNAVAQIREKNPNVQLPIPALSSLIN